MKKLSVFLFVLILSSLLLIPTAAVEAPVVYVTVSDGTPVLIQKPVTVTDTDNDGSLTVSDALYLAHETYYPGKAAEGYGVASGDYGLYLTKLWGKDNGGGYGYFLNNNSVLSIGDTVKNGDYITAFLYNDTATFSDVYSYFNENTVSSPENTEFSLTLISYAYAEDWSAILNPVSNAAITVNGEKTDYKTDENGKVTLKFNTAGEYVISAQSQDLTLVPPVCTASISTASPKTNDINVLLIMIPAVLAVAFFTILRTEKLYEKQS